MTTIAEEVVGNRSFLLGQHRTDYGAPYFWQSVYQKPHHSAGWLLAISGALSYQLANNEYCGAEVATQVAKLAKVSFGLLAKRNRLFFRTAFTIFTIVCARQVFLLYEWVEQNSTVGNQSPSRRWNPRLGNVAQTLSNRLSTRHEEWGKTRNLNVIES